MYVPSQSHNFFFKYNLFSVFSSTTIGAFFNMVEQHGPYSEKLDEVS